MSQSVPKASEPMMLNAPPTAARSPFRRLWVYSAAILVLFLIAISLGTQDDHRTNLGYLIWKHGWSPRTWRENYHLYLEDGDFQAEMAGRTLAQLRPWFPDLVPAGQGTELQRQFASEYRLDPASFVWFGDFLEGIELEDSRYSSLVFYDHG